MGGDGTRNCALDLVHGVPENTVASRANADTIIKAEDSSRFIKLEKLIGLNSPGSRVLLTTCRKSAASLQKWASRAASSVFHLRAARVR
jgi:hypothetical protein